MVTVTAVNVARNTPYETSIYFAMMTTGVGLWTLMEYLLHRFVLHSIPMFAAMHEVHHDTPVAYVGTPTWLSLGVMVGAIFLPTWALASFNEASGLTVGVTLASTASTAGSPGLGGVTPVKFLASDPLQVRFDLPGEDDWYWLRDEMRILCGLALLTASAFVFWIYRPRGSMPQPPPDWRNR